MSSSDKGRARTPQPPSHAYRNISPNAPLFSASFIASWRGQVLICTVCLAFGAIYFFVRRAVSPILRRRREAISEARQAELMSLEAEDRKKEASEPATSVEKGGSGGGGKDAKGKDRRKDSGKKRKTSSTVRLGVVQPGSPSVQAGLSATESNLSQAGPSSRETSPSSRYLTLPTPKSTGKARGKGSGKDILQSRDRSLSNSSRSPSPSYYQDLSPRSSPTPLIRIRQPTAEDAPLAQRTADVRADPTRRASSSMTTPIKSQMSRNTRNDGGTHARTETETNPANPVNNKPISRHARVDTGITDPLLIPLPPSPGGAEHSRRSRYDSLTNGNSSDSTTDTTPYIQSVTGGLRQGALISAKSNSDIPRTSTSGFSIIPDPGYLPPSVLSNKRKKKKDRTPDIFDNHLNLSLSNSSNSNNRQPSDSRQCSSGNSTNHNHSSDNLSRYSQPTSVDTESVAPTSPSSKSNHIKQQPTATPPILRPAFRGHSRKSSLKSVRPPHNPTAQELEAYCSERDQVIDSLRAELGIARAQEAKAKEEESTARKSQVKGQKDTEHLTQQASAVRKEHRIVLKQVSLHSPLSPSQRISRIASAICLVHIL